MDIFAASFRAWRQQTT